mgnify:CR=1 FL=1
MPKTSYISRDNKFIIIIFLLFTISRLLVFFLFNFEFLYFLDGYVQYLDVNLLKGELFQSIYYLHSQPPLFNFFIGLIEKLSPVYSAIIFQFIFILIGLLTNILLFKLLRGVGVNSYLSLMFTIFYLLSPATLLYENLFFYTHIIIFFLISAGYYLNLFIRQGKFRYVFFHFLFLSLCVLTTSFFHLLWFLVLLGILILTNRDNWKTIMKGAIFPLLLILSLYLKNYFIFDSFSSSTWLGMNLSRITVNQLPEEEKKRLIQNGLLNDVAKLEPFPVGDSLIFIKDLKLDPITHIKSLDEKFKKSGHTNYNNLIYIKVSKFSFQNAIYTIVHCPQAYVSGVKKAFCLYFDSPTKYTLLEQNTYKIKKYNRLFDAFIYGTSASTAFGYISIISIPLMLLLGAMLIIKNETKNNIKVILIFLIFNILYVMIIGNFFELGENNRFRYYTEIYHFIIWAILLQNLFNRKKTEQL